ncbi:hypothetical protein [Pantoea sp. App145]|uniref:hypothetical protein n=1 Tax=Pantoea sp. App145 TaxID=3071567 RepID=UPI003A8106C3
MRSTDLNLNNTSLNFTQLYDAKNNHRTLNENKDVKILNYQEHPLLMDAEEKLAESKWDRDIRQLVLDIVREESGKPDAESYDALLNANVSKNDFIRLILANKNGESISKDNNSHLLSKIEKKDVSNFKDKIAGMVKASPERTELLLKNGTYGLAQQLQADRWDAQCCDKAMKLVNAMWDGCLTDTVSDKEFPLNAVNNANLQEHINNHFSKPKDRHTSPTIEKNQFLRLLLAAKKQQVTSSPSPAEIQELQSTIEKELAERPLTSQQALVPEHNPFANTEKITFDRVENGRSLSDMTLVQKATLGLYASNALKDIAPPTLSKPERRFKDPKAGKTGLVKTADKDKTPFTKMPGTCKADYSNKTIKTDNTINTDNSVKTDNTIAKSVQTILTTAAATMLAGPKAGLAAFAVSMAAPTEEAMINIHTKARHEQIEKETKLKEDMLKSIEDNVDIDIADQPGDMMRSALLQAYRWAPFLKNAEERIDNDRIIADVIPSTFPALYLKAKILGEKIEKGFTPIDIASGLAKKFIEENRDTFLNIVGWGGDLTWPADYPGYLRTAMEDGDILKIIEDKVDAALKDPKNIRKIKESLRGTADVMADIYNITHPNSPVGKLTRADLDNVQQLVFQGTTLSNLFLHKGYIFSINPGFEPVNLNRLMSSLFTPMPKELRDEIDLGLSFRNRVEYNRKDKVLIPNKADEITRRIQGLIPGKLSGKVENILSKPAIDNVDSDFDFATWTRWESNIFRGAETLKAVLALFPIWGPAMKITPLVNYGISLLGCSPSIIKSVIEDNPEKQKKHITDALFALGTNAFAGSASTLNAPAIKNLAAKAAQAISKYPQGKVDVIAKFMKAAGVLTGNKASGGIKNVADFWNSLNQGQKMLMARVLGNSGKLFNDKLAKLFANENKGTTAATEPTAASSTQNSQTTRQTQGVSASSASQTTEANAQPKQYYVSIKGESIWDIALKFESEYENAARAFWETNRDTLPGAPFITEELPEFTPVEMPDYNKFGKKAPAQ